MSLVAGSGAGGDGAAGVAGSVVSGGAGAPAAPGCGPSAAEGDCACNNPTDCELRSAGCCDSCEPVTASNLIAVNRAAAQPICGVRCKSCPSPAPNEGKRRYFMPDCVEHRCTVIDIRETPITECASSSECALRGSTDCCRCGDPNEPIAFNLSIDQIATFCGGLMHSCPACMAGPIPPELITECQGGRCVVERVK
jgi:hypothetical protein